MKWSYVVHTKHFTAVAGWGGATFNYFIHNTVLNLGQAPSKNYIIVLIWIVIEGLWYEFFGHKL